MDSALELRLLSEKNIELNEKQIMEMLNSSKLTNDYEKDHMFNIFRIICLSEIPYIENLDYTTEVIDYVSTNLATTHGFSYTGKVEDIVPCYNAMLLEAYTRLNRHNSIEVKNALKWIKQYQLFERNAETSWSYKGIKKHGGCLNAIPCYIGIGKSVRALLTYNEKIKNSDIEVNLLIEKGIKYMLSHKMFLRLSNNQPISRHITDNMFPQSYMLSLTDLIYIISKAEVLNNKDVIKLKQLLNNKMIYENTWKIDYIYKFRGYQSFENKSKNSEWLSELYKIWLYKK